MVELAGGLRRLYRHYNTGDTFYGEDDCRFLMPQLMNELKAFLKYPVIQEIYNKNCILLDEYADRHLFKGLFYNLLKDIQKIIGQ